MPQDVVPSTKDETTTESAPPISPLQFPEGYVPGKYAPWYCSESDAYGPDELGPYQAAIDDMIENVNKCDAAARIWEVLQSWEMRLFRRNYHFLTAGWKGWGMNGGSAGTSGAAILQSQNTMKLFSCNVFGARHKKITALLSRVVPPVEVVADDENDPMDTAAAEEAEKYLKVFQNDCNLKEGMTKAAGLFFTDGRAGFLTYTIADESRWGTETPDRDQAAYGMPKSDGVTPETAMLPAKPESEQPARREITWVGGKLEWKVPLMADEENEMGWARAQHEVSLNMLKAKYPWIRAKIAAGGNVGGMDQIDRLARINVRLAVQASSSSGESYKNDATETVTFFRPSQYEAIADENVRKVYYDTFPDGLEVWHAGGQLALVRNCRITDHVKIVHATTGDGQNREAIGTNYLPMQKVLNANISLLDRYFRSAVPRRFAMEPFIDTHAMNTQSNDPSKTTAVYLKGETGLRIPDLTGIENVPQPNDAIFQFVQWLIQGAPEAMDGGAPAVFGMDTGGKDAGTFGEAKLDRDQALQVFSMPWASLCYAVTAICQQAIESAAANRVKNISASLPGQQRLEIELQKLKGSVIVHPVTLEIPQTLAEEQEQMVALLEQSANVALYQQIMMDPSNLAVFSKFPMLKELNVPGADAAEQQQGEFEILMRSGPIDNPQLAAIAQQVTGAEIDPEAQTPEGQQALMQLQQMAQTLPPQVSTVPVAQDTSENHMIHAAITLGMLTSPTGRKLKNGTDEQKQIWQNLKLHWQEHMAMLKQLAPPKEMEFKGSVSIDPSKFPPQAQTEMFEAMGLQIPPFALEAQPQEHEITQEKEGVDAQGVPVKQKISVVGKPLS